MLFRIILSSVVFLGSASVSCDAQQVDACGFFRRVASNIRARRTYRINRRVNRRIARRASFYGQPVYSAYSQPVYSAPVQSGYYTVGLPPGAVVISERVVSSEPVVEAPAVQSAPVIVQPSAPPVRRGYYVQQRTCVGGSCSTQWTWVPQ